MERSCALTPPVIAGVQGSSQKAAEGFAVNLVVSGWCLF